MPRPHLRLVHRCSCPECHAQSRGATAKLHRGINRVLAALDERNRRRFAGLWATHLGWGGIQRVAEITGLSRPTIARGRRELQTGGGPASRIRRPGGGRPRAEHRFPGASTGPRVARR